MYNNFNMVNKTKEEFHLAKPIHHVAFIMDGNGRWAKARGLPRYKGHKAGCDRIIEISDACIEFGIPVMSLYAFSTENWKRPADEIKKLFYYLDLFFKKQIGKMMKDGIKVVVSGDISPLPTKTKTTIYKAIEMTKDNKVQTFNICLNYGGRAEIVKACQDIAKEVLDRKIQIEDINENLFSSHLYTKDLPEVDLLIRTSGELRTSNYLPWQLAYAEFVFPNTPWPDFNREEFIKALKEYEHRQRRYGGLKNE